MFSPVAVKSRLEKSTFWASVLTLASGATLAQLIGFFTTPVVSRIYEPKAFGDLAVVSSVSALAINVSGLGLTSAVMMPSSDRECRDVFMVAFLSQWAISTAVFLTLVAVSPFVRLFHAGIDYIAACLLAYVLTVLRGFSGLLSVYANRRRLDRVLFYNSLISALATLCVSIPLGLLGIGSLGLVIASIIAAIASILQMVYHASPLNWPPRISVFGTVYSRYKDFIRYQYPSNFVETAAIQLPTQVLSAVFGNVSLGAYSMCEKVLGIPSRLIGTPINTVYFRTASEFHKEGRDLARFTFFLVTRIMLVSIAPIAVTVFWGEQLFMWALGRNWGEAGRLASLLIVQYVFAFCATCTSYCRVAIGRQKANLVVSVLRLVLVAFSIAVGVSFLGGFRNTIVVFTVATSLYYIVDMAINFRCMGGYSVRYLTFACIYSVAILVSWVLAGVL